MDGIIFLASFLALLTARTLFGGTVAADLLLYAAAVFGFFYLRRPSGAWMLAGLTAGVELLGSAPFGQGVLLAVIVVGLTAILGERMRFTSRFPRYIVAVLITMAAYVLFFLSWRIPASYAGAMAGVAALAAVAGFLSSNRGKETEYELL